MADTTQQATAPGLEAKAQKTFDVPYAELTPRLQGVVRKRVIKDAAEDLLKAAKFLIEFIEANDEFAIMQMEDALAYLAAKSAVERAEGR